jgi:hypothetical protein
MIWQRRLGWLEELDSYRHALERPWVDSSWLIVLPAASDGGGVLLPVARGRVLSRRRLMWGETGWRRVVEEACYEVRVAELRAESVFPAAELTRSLIVTAWLENGTAEGRALNLDAMDTRAVLQALEAGRSSAGT